MNHDRLILILAVNLACVGVAVWALCQAAARDRTRLPGRLARDGDWPEIAAWEEHCRTTPGVGEVGETPIFDALCVDFWERSYDWPEVIDFDAWPGEQG